MPIAWQIARLSMNIVKHLYIGQDSIIPRSDWTTPKLIGHFAGELFRLDLIFFGFTGYEMSRRNAGRLHQLTQTDAIHV